MLVGAFGLLPVVAAFGVGEPIAQEIVNELVGVGLVGVGIVSARSRVICERGELSYRWVRTRHLTAGQLRDIALHEYVVGNGLGRVCLAVVPVKGRRVKIRPTSMPNRAQNRERLESQAMRMRTVLGL